MSNRNVKLGTRETSVRFDGSIAVYQYMADPTLSQEELELAKKIDYTPSRWVLVEVRPKHS